MNFAQIRHTNLTKLSLSYRAAEPILDRAINAAYFPAACTATENW